MIGAAGARGHHGRDLGCGLPSLASETDVDVLDGDARWRMPEASAGAHGGPGLGRATAEPTHRFMLFPRC